jgi:hypothetical protein
MRTTQPRVVQPSACAVRLLALSACAPALRGREAFREVVKFSRPHTMLGTGISVLSLSAWAAPTPSVGVARALTAMSPALLANVYIVGACALPPCCLFAISHLRDQ